MKDALKSFLKQAAIPAEWKDAHTDIPWSKIAALGNRLRHNYDVVDLDTLLVIIEDHLPALATTIEAMIARRDDE